MLIVDLHNPASPVASRRPAMSEADYAFAVEKRRQGASWDSIGLMLQRPADAVRQACDPAYVSPFAKARPVAVIPPDQALLRRLTADGMARPIARLICALNEAREPVPIDTLFDLTNHLPKGAGFKSRQGAACQLRTVASAAGYVLKVSPRGYALSPKAREALTERLAAPVR